MKLSDNEIRDITLHLESGKSLPDHLRDEEGFKKYKPADFTGLVAGFTEYQGELSC